MLLNELEAHNPLLLTKPRLLVVSKIDLLDQAARKTLSVPKGIACCPISASTGEGIIRLKDLIWEKLSV